MANGRSQAAAGKPSASGRKAGKARAAAGAGVLPALQNRSRAKQAALITAGIRMLESRDYHSLSIAELTAANGVSVGTFYARFSCKDAFFDAVQTQVFADVEAEARTLFAPEAWAGRDAADVIAAFVAFLAGLVRRHRGVIHAALQREAVQPGAWTPIRQSGAAIAAPFQEVLAPKLPHLAPAVRSARIGFALQMLYGTLINTLLHEPGPLGLHDARLTRELQGALCAYLGAPLPTGSGSAIPKHYTRRQGRTSA